MKKVSYLESFRILPQRLMFALEEKLQNQLRQLNVDKDQLSTSGRFQCRSLANIASLLGLTDVRTSW